MDAKSAFLQSEGDAHFRRNFNPDRSNCAKGTQLLSRFLSRNLEILQGEDKKAVLEIGCDYGFNLMYLNQKFPLKCYGVEPSKEAVEYGRKAAAEQGLVDMELFLGTADALPFADESMDIVILGFVMYCVDRSLVWRSVAEADRVLKRGGFLVIEDFDPPLPCKRAYKHFKGLYSYKINNTSLFLGDPSYTLIEKTSYSHASQAFEPAFQERVSSSILYKERIKDIYLLCGED